MALESTKLDYLCRKAKEENWEEIKMLPYMHKIDK